MQKNSMSQSGNGAEGENVPVGKGLESFLNSLDVEEAEVLFFGFTGLEALIVEFKEVYVHAARP